MADSPSNPADLGAPAEPALLPTQVIPSPRPLNQPVEEPTRVVLGQVLRRHGVLARRRGARLRMVGTGVLLGAGAVAGLSVWLSQLHGPSAPATAGPHEPGVSVPDRSAEHLPSAADASAHTSTPRPAVSAKPAAHTNRQGRQQGTSSSAAQQTGSAGAQAAEAQQSTGHHGLTHPQPTGTTADPNSGSGSPDPLQTAVTGALDGVPTPGW